MYVTGRWRPRGPDERICQLCDLDDMEDKYHIVMKCPKYEICRTIMFRNISRSCHEFNNLDDLSLSRLWESIERPVLII